jgi:hypothetical protein
VLIGLFRRFILDQILSGDPTEIVVQNIHEYLTNVGDNVRSGKVKVDDFIIYKVSVFYFLCDRNLPIEKASGQRP